MIESIRKLLGIRPKADLALLARNGAILLDVRSKSEFATGHIRGSVNISLDRLADNLNKLKDKHKPIITCCASGMRSASAKRFLISKGYTQVYNGGGWLTLRNKIS